MLLSFEERSCIECCVVHPAAISMDPEAMSSAHAPLEPYFIYYMYQYLHI